MTGRYKAYPEYKESGAKWLGNIPSNWGVKKLKYLCQIQTGTKDTVNAVDNGKYPFFVRSQTIEKINSVGANCEAVLTAGDGVGVGKVYHYFNGKFDFHQRVYMLNNFNTVSGRFVYYYLSSNFYKVAMEGNAKSTVDSLRLPQFLNFEFSLPVMEEQNKIVNFLDHETAKIDTLITKQEKLIELLKEKRQAVISHAVTKGLNPDAPMKDSGVEWLGEVPEHWRVSKFAYLKTILTDYTANGSFADLKTNVEYKDTPSFARLVRLTDLRVDLKNDNGVWIDESSYKFLRKSALYGGEFLLANVGAYAGLFYQMPFDKGAASLAPNMFMAKFNTNKVLREFMAYIGQSNGISSQLKLSATAASAQPKLNKDDFKSVRFAYPDTIEQRGIVKLLDKELPKIDLLMTKQQQAVELMKERKTALISAAVTGKIDVRDWQGEA